MRFASVSVDILEPESVSTSVSPALATSRSNLSCSGDRIPALYAIASELIKSCAFINEVSSRLDYDGVGVFHRE